MSNGIQASVVHEAEAQRQHPRVRIPATLHIGADGRGRAYKVLDVSLGGFSFDAQNDEYVFSSSHKGTLDFAIEPIGLSLPVTFQVRNLDHSGRRVGCEFTDIDRRKAAMLRHLIGAHLAGELISVGDVLTTLSRDNYTKPRNKQEMAKPKVAERTRAVTLTGIIFTIGVAAFLYAASKLYGVVFVTHATAAKVAAPSFAITMPRDGTYFSLIPPDGKVKKGQPLGTFQAAMLDVVQNDPGVLHLTPQQISSLMGETLKGTLSSPCDCTVHDQYALDSQFVNRNQPLMELLPDNAKPYVLARFHFDSMKDLGVGSSVSFHISGEAADRYGKVRLLRMLPGPASTTDLGAATDLRGLNTPGPVSDVVAEIEPNTPINSTLIERPVDVSVGDPRSGIANLFQQGVDRVRALVAGT
ncbi:MAG TPA: PilZ domain-containing protein [Rhodanobacteraceae bacterium]|nr:PilZ domain-containing protein [Rhodanobacteraceae bacterium]